MDKKVGVYICSGCDIGTCLDAQKLADIASAEHNIPIIKTSPAFCLEDARLIKNDIEQEGVDSVVIAACSPRVNTDVFGFKNAFVERVNIREQVAWSHPANHPETQSMAEDYLRMGIVRAQKATSPTPYTEANERSILVVGGGAAGLAAAEDAAKTGFDVVLVEKSARLGGYASRLHKQFPKRSPHDALEPVDIRAKIQEVESLPNVRGAHGGGGRGDLGPAGPLQRDGQARRRRGADDGGSRRSGHGLDAGRPCEIHLLRARKVSQRGDQHRAGGDGRAGRDHAPLGRPAGAERRPHPVRRAGGRPPPPVRRKRVPAWWRSSRPCISRERHPDSIVYLLYGDMQTPGQYEYFYKRVQEDEGVLFSRGEIQNVTEDAEHNVRLEVSNNLIGDTIQAEVDLLVLSAGMGSGHPGPGTPRDPSTLQYLQGKDLPTTEFGYADSHFICFPYETLRTGIYSAGAVRQAMDLAASAQDGTAAALKAIQCIEKSSAGVAVHPRVGDLSYPSFFMQRCTSCGRCSQECPFGALEVDDDKHPTLDPNRCRRCGICMGACPVQIISFNDYSLDMLSNMIKAVEIPEDDEDKPRILVLACENDAYPALDMAGINRLNCPASIRVIPVRCLARSTPS